MNNNFKIFTTSWFVIGLSLLLLNDFVLKELFGNWFTGKLSDFAGLLIFPLFWTAFFPRHKKVIFILTALLFILWKSPMSQTFIDSWNGLGVFPISRVVDYSDLIALAILPLAYYLDSIKFQLTTIQARPVFPILIAAFSFGATSYSSNVRIDKSYTVSTQKDSLINRIERLDSVHFINKNQHSDTMRISFPNELCFDKVEVNIIVHDNKDGTSSVTLLDGTYDCPKEKNEQEKISKGFEDKVIKQIEF